MQAYAYGPVREALDPLQVRSIEPPNDFKF